MDTSSPSEFMYDIPFIHPTTTFAFFTILLVTETPNPPEMPPDPVTAGS